LSTGYKINGRYVTKEEWDATPGVGLQDGCPMATVAYSESRPMISEGLGCMKSQVLEMRDVVKKNNIKGVRVLDSGQLEITSRRGRRDLLRVRGLADAEGGYSD
jgi:hypothetical protein